MLVSTATSAARPLLLVTTSTARLTSKRSNTSGTAMGRAPRDGASVSAGTLSRWSRAASRGLAAPPAALKTIRVTLSVYNCIRRCFYLQHCSKILEDDTAARGCHRRQYPKSAIQPRRASAAQGSPGRRCRRSACRASIDLGCLARRCRESAARRYRGSASAARCCPGRRGH